MPGPMFILGGGLPPGGVSVQGVSEGRESFLWDSAAILTIKRSEGDTSEVNLRNPLHTGHEAHKQASAINVTRRPKQGFQ